MKKLLGISLFAILAATPLMASAADTAPVAIPEAKSGLAANGTNVVTATKGKYYAGETITDADKAAAASAAYVKGAYNAAISAVNKVAEGKQDALTPGDGIDIVKTTNQTTGDVTNTIKVDLKDNAGLKIDNEKLAIKTGDGISVSANGVAVNAKNGGGITSDSTGVYLTNGIQNATNTTTYKGTGLTTKGYVDEKVAGATSGMVTADSTTTFTNKTINAEQLSHLLVQRVLIPHCQQKKPFGPQLQMQQQTRQQKKVFLHLLIKQQQKVIFLPMLVERLVVL